MQHQRKMVAVDHAPARSNAAAERDGSSKSPITPCTPARVARSPLLSRTIIAPPRAAVHGAERLAAPAASVLGRSIRLAPLLHA